MADAVTTALPATAPIAVETAMDSEAKGIIASLENPVSRTIFGRTLVTGTLAGRTVTVCAAGMGRTAAAAGAQLLMDEAVCDGNHPGLLLFSGIAGSIDPGIGVGDIVVGAELRYRETRESMIGDSYPFRRFFESDPRLARLALDELESEGYRRIASLKEKAEGTSVPGAPASASSQGNGHLCTFGVIATSDNFNTDPAVLDESRRTIHAECEECEGAAAGHVACMCRVPFLAIRSISNVCGVEYEDMDGIEDVSQQTADQAARVTVGVIRRLGE